jgi:hypothetical protein
VPDDPTFTALSPLAQANGAANAPQWAANVRAVRAESPQVGHNAGRDADEGEAVDDV